MVKFINGHVQNVLSDLFKKFLYIIDFEGNI